MRPVLAVVGKNSNGAAGADFMTKPQIDEPAMLIWTPDGSWLQTTVDGLRRTSHLGKIGDREQVQKACEERGLRFKEFRSNHVWYGRP